MSALSRSCCHAILCLSECRYQHSCPRSRAVEKIGTLSSHLDRLEIVPAQPKTQRVDYRPAIHDRIAATMTYAASTYGDEIADVYDAVHGEVDPHAPALLTEVAGRGPVLELGIGTGRLALGLVQRGVSVSGIDASPAMIAKLRSKPGGDEIPVTIGDFSKVKLEQQFTLIFIAFNTFFALLTAADQVRCFRNVASMLRPGGCFLLEAFVPDLGRFDRGQRFSVFRIDPDAVWLEASRHDPASQTVDSHLVRLSNAGVRLFPLRVRYAWPSELDLMAAMAGLRLRDRWSAWGKQPFSSASTAHISVYERLE
jgi:SAM-dependent methyltransferase